MHTLRRPFLAVAASLLLCLLAPLPPASSAVPLHGLAVAVTADGTRLVAGGDSRAIYELDPQTLAVKQRVHIGHGIVALGFSADGKRLWAESTKAVHILDGVSFKMLKTIEKVERMNVVPAAGIVAVRAQRGGEIQLLSIDDGSAQGSVPYDRMKSVAAFGLRPDGKRLALLYSRKSTKDEKKVPYKELPKDLKGAALSEFKQRNDGYGAQFVLFEVPSGKVLLDKQLWYSAGGGSRIAWHAGLPHVVGYDNQNAQISTEGKVTYFELGNSYNYGIGISTDGATVLSGGLRDGSRTTLADRKSTKFRIDKLPGFPEYFKSFTVAADGTGFGGTSCWRVVRLDPAGKIEKVAPIY